MSKINPWDTLTLERAVIDDHRLHKANGRCDMCGNKKPDLVYDVIYDGEGNYYHWVCETCLNLLGKKEHD